MTGHVAIIGAGVAGLSAARLLREAGVPCTLFDKSRGLGGRMATRRAGEFQFDHGAQYFTAKGARFASVVSGWREAGCAAEWFEGAYVGAPGMTAPARALADGLDVVASFEVKGLRAGHDGWSLLGASGAAGRSGEGPFEAVLLALPAPQISPILASAGLSFAALANIRYAPCWAAMLAYAARIDLPWTHVSDAHPDLPWIARNATKPMRGGPHETFVVHAGADWSARHLELAQDEALARLLPLFREATGIEDEPAYATAHRWRYALVQETAGAPCLWNEAARVGACGDWCLGPRVECAFESGESMARLYLEASHAR